MSPLESHLRSLRDAGTKGVIPFVSVGDPDLDTSAEIICALSDAGAAAIEIGVPFSDPIADGPTIQWASQRALSGGTTLDGIFRMLTRIRPRVACPMVLFSYLNPMSRMGYETMAARAVDAGISGVLVTDAPPGAEQAFDDALANAKLDRIALVAPTTPNDRLALLSEAGGGFMYVIARRGVTGRGAEQDEAATQVSRLRKTTDLPLYVGFGVRTREDVIRNCAVADGVIVGSALVDALHAVENHGQRPQVAHDFLSDLIG